MAKLTLYKSNMAYFDSYNDNIRVNLNATSWALLDKNKGTVYGVIYGNNFTFDSYQNPVLGTITSMSQFDKFGNMQWNLSNIGVASNMSSSLEYVLKNGNPFEQYYYISTLLKGDDSIIGSTGNDIISVSEGIDTIDGGTGTDYISLSEINTWYSEVWNVDLLSKKYYKQLSNGVPTIQGYLSNIENIIGSDGNDILLGDNLNNIFGSSRGNDSINGNDGVDTLNYKTCSTINLNLSTSTCLKQFNNTYSISDYTDTVSNIENIIGSWGNDSIIGNSLNNVLDGYFGNDTIDGGAGTDTVSFSSNYQAVYVSLSSGSASGAGTDKLLNIENVIGTNYNDNLNGSVTSNVLTGNSGNDKLAGGSGNDTLTGGMGQDNFIFNSALASNKDTITDFSVIDDTIQLENAIFTKLTATGTLSSSYFKLGTVAGDSNDYIIYNKSTEAVYYDDDGSGSHASIQIAVVGLNLAITNTDFLVI